MKKPSFLDRLTGNVSNDDFDDVLDREVPEDEMIHHDHEYGESEWPQHEEEEPQEGELPVDMYQTSDNIVIRAMVAGVSPEDLDIAITRDMVTIRGQRAEIQEAPDDDYYHRELFWGAFSRTLLLPEEVIIDEADAKEKHGLLEIILPKLDKNRSTKLKVKSGTPK